MDATLGWAKDSGPNIRSAPTLKIPATGYVLDINHILSPPPKNSRIINNHYQPRGRRRHGAFTVEAGVAGGRGRFFTTFNGGPSGPRNRPRARLSAIRLKKISGSSFVLLLMRQAFRKATKHHSYYYTLNTITLLYLSKSGPL